MLAAALAYGSPAANITAASASNVMAALEAVLNRIVAAEGGKEGFAAQYRRWEVAPACVQIYAVGDRVVCVRVAFGCEPDTCMAWLDVRVVQVPHLHHFESVRYAFDSARHSPNRQGR